MSGIILENFETKQHVFEITYRYFNTNKDDKKPKTYFFASKNEFIKVEYHIYTHQERIDKGWHLEDDNDYFSFDTYIHRVLFTINYVDLECHNKLKKPIRHRFIRNGECIEIKFRSKGI
jgi:hypothetical protein